MKPVLSETQSLSVQDLDERARSIFRRLVENYLKTGEAQGSHALSQCHDIDLSPASVRTSMAHLTELGLLKAAHVSAGRAPTHTGLRLFIDGFLELGDLDDQERANIEHRLHSTGRDMEETMIEASDLLSGLARGAGLVLAPEHEENFLHHIEFVSLDTKRALAVVVYEDGSVENRIIALPSGFSAPALIEAGHYLSHHLCGRPFEKARQDLLETVERDQSLVDACAREFIEQGLAEWGGGEKRTLIVRGRSHLLSEDNQKGMERIRQLLDDIERKEDIVRLLDKASAADSVTIFIGSETSLFSLSGSSLIVAPYSNHDRKIVGAIGLIGPTHLNYARIVPVVDYTARLMGRILDEDKL